MRCQKTEVKIILARQNWLLAENASKLLDKLYDSLDELMLNV